MNTKLNHELPLKRILSFILFLSFLTNSSFSQEASLEWPGDCNKNGQVTIVDMLYYAVAKGTEGPGRANMGNQWLGYNPPTPWANSFGNGLNYCHADADGTGRIDHKDRDAIIKVNYGKTHGTVSPDVFTVGDPQLDPQLLVTPQTTSIRPGQKLRLDLELGNLDRPIDNIFGIVFRLKFDHDLVKDDHDWDLHKPKKTKFKLDNGSWFNIGGVDGVESQMRVDNESGQLEVSLTREASGGISGFGDIGVFEIVMEDIVLLQGQQRELNLRIDNILMIDEDFNTFPVAGSETLVIVEEPNGEIAGLLQSNESNEEATEAALSDDPQLEDDFNEVEERTDLVAADFKLYPNPVEKELWVEWSQNEKLQSIEVFNIHGQLVLNRIVAAESQKERLYLDNTPKGTYLVKLTTEDGRVESFKIFR